VGTASARGENGRLTRPPRFVAAPPAATRVATASPDGTEPVVHAAADTPGAPAGHPPTPSESAPGLATFAHVRADAASPAWGAPRPVGANVGDPGATAPRAASSAAGEESGGSFSCVASTSGA
jgi:hypothetical protein